LLKFPNKQGNIMTQKHVINSQLICANYEQEYPMIERGEGIYLYDTNGKEYIDGCGCTAVVTSLGHGNEEVAQALYEQTKKLSVHPTHLFYNQELETYLKNLCAFAPSGFNHAWTIAGGTEAVENSIKLAYQYHRSKGNRKTKVLARWGSYHGNSLTILDVGGMKARRDYYTDLMVGHLHASPCLPYRKPEDMSLEQYEDSLIAEFEQMVTDNKDDVLAFLAEPIVGAALGAVEPTENYFKKIATICKREDILIISDEVMTGFGRTGSNFGCEHYGEYADIIACAKGISGGYFPLGALLAHDRVLEPIRESDKPFFSGQTYSCIPQAAAVGNKVLEIIKRDNLVENSKVVGKYLKEKFISLAEEFDVIGDVRGRGLFLALEFVKDKKTKEVIRPELNFSKLLEKLCLENGLVTYAGRGTVDLSRGDHMLFAPPLTLTTKEADLIVERLKISLLEAVKQI
jgi:adenosylmethionine-8-amino-7-oxononanoate aminotransferase